ncbi:hypothetical protein J6590_012314 [Homalodisca vitripennis]|nr:hypothetical protein J6590_012314 [Homalodisca vitripennis]
MSGFTTWQSRFPRPAVGRVGRPGRESRVHGATIRVATNCYWTQEPLIHLVHTTFASGKQAEGSWDWRDVLNQTPVINLSLDTVRQFGGVLGDVEKTEAELSYRPGLAADGEEGTRETS